jgi:hypothetical protein
MKLTQMRARRGMPPQRLRSPPLRSPATDWGLDRWPPGDSVPSLDRATRRDSTGEAAQWLREAAPLCAQGVRQRCQEDRRWHLASGRRWFSARTGEQGHCRPSPPLRRDHSSPFPRSSVARTVRAISRTIGRMPPFHALRDDARLPSSVRGPVDRSHSFAARARSDCCCLRWGVQLLLLVVVFMVFLQFVWRGF